MNRAVIEKARQGGMTATTLEAAKAKFVTPPMEKDIRDLLAIMARIVHEKGPWKDKQKKVLKIAQETDESFSVFSEFLSLFLDEPKETD